MCCTPDLKIANDFGTDRISDKHNTEKFVHSQRGYYAQFRMKSFINPFSGASILKVAIWEVWKFDIFEAAP